MTAVNAYRLLAADYNEAPNALLSLNRRTLPDLFPPLAGRVVIDVAAGTGYWADWCAKRGAFAVATDLCWEMLAQSPQRPVLADAAHLPFPSACADVAICSFGLGYAPECMRELARITKRGGFVIASDAHPDAIKRGWTRSFRRAGQVLEVAHHRYTLDQLQVPSLHLDGLLEPTFGDPERVIFEESGKPELFAAASTYPAIFAAKWRRV